MRWQRGLAYTVIGLTATSATMGDPLSNGDFEAGALALWVDDGTVQLINNAGNYLAVLEEPGAGGRSRVYQTAIDVPVTPTHLSFRYYFKAAPGVRDTAVPPDSFSAYLTDDSGNRLVVPGASDPTFSQAFFYTDSDGATLYEATYVTVAQYPDTEGLYTVVLEIPSITNPVRVEFGLDGAGNGITSFALLDDVQFGAIPCPQGYCCNPDGTVQNLIDDGNPCTADKCNSATGAVANEDLPCCQGCLAGSPTAADVVIMVDASASVGVTGFNVARQAVLDLLDFLEPYSGRPAIQVGRMHDADGVIINDSPVGYGSLDTAMTTDYGLIRDVVGDSQLFSRIVGSRTPLEDGIKIGYKALAAFGTSGHRRYVWLITDGWTNEEDNALCGPGNGCCPGDPQGSSCDGPEQCHCECETARGFAEDQADLAESATNDATVLVAHFVGEGTTICNTTAYVDSAVTFLRDRIATDDAIHFREDDLDLASDSLSCALIDFAEVINCDDGDPDTIDTCGADGQCSHSTP